MLEDELKQLVQSICHGKYEKQNIELKKALGGAPKRLYDTLSSFSNQYAGGTIIFGIDEEQDYAVCGVYNVQDLQKKVTEQSLQMFPKVRLVFTVAEMEPGKYVVSAEVPEIDMYAKPCFYEGAGRLRGSYVRVGDADLPMTEYEVYSYEAFKRRLQDELRHPEDSDLTSLDPVLLDSYVLALLRQKHNLKNLTKERLLHTQGILKNGQLTLAGLLLFGAYPQEFLPQLSVIAMVVPGEEMGDIGSDNERFIDNKRIEGNLPQMLEEALQFVRKNMSVKTIINPDTGKREDKPEYPLVAVREVILNALVHRDYSIYTDNSPIRIVLYKNRLEVENPGGLYGRITVRELGNKPADTRNPFIAGALEVVINSENRYSGIPTIRKAMAKAELPPPAFYNERGNFKVVLYNERKTTSLVDDGEIRQRTDLLDYCRVPRSRQEIADFYGVKKTTYFMNKYVNPLVEQGVLQLTLREHPKSKHQKYYCP